MGQTINIIAEEEQVTIGAAYVVLPKPKRVSSAILSFSFHESHAHSRNRRHKYVIRRQNPSIDSIDSLHVHLNNILIKGIPLYMQTKMNVIFCKTRCQNMSGN